MLILKNCLIYSRTVTFGDRSSNSLLEFSGHILCSFISCCILMRQNLFTACGLETRHLDILMFYLSTNMLIFIYISIQWGWVGLQIWNQILYIIWIRGGGFFKIFKRYNSLIFPMNFYWITSSPISQSALSTCVIIVLFHYFINLMSFNFLRNCSLFNLNM